MEVAVPEALADMTLNYSVTGGTATEDTDFTIDGTELNFAIGGELTQSVTLHITDDETDDDDETIILTLDDNGAGYNISQTTMTITITDNDDAADDDSDDVDDDPTPAAASSGGCTLVISR